MSYASEVLSDSPTAYWHLDETSGTTAADSSGNGNTATFSTSIVHIGQAPLIHDGYSFQWYGTGNTTIATAGFGTLGGGAWTVEAWINTSASQDQPILALFNSGVVNLFFRVTTSGNVSAASTVLAAGGSTATSVTSNVVNDGQTHHVVAVKSGSTIHIYIDGVEAAYSTQTSYLAPDEVVAGGSGSIGYSSTVFSGNIDELAFWNQTA
ncbi:MAG: LamG domain-containing protein, partial [Patescibacteria group bacterium]|nr:LamG domain-containing protein [Patescibacteria group bacterium]